MNLVSHFKSELQRFTSLHLQTRRLFLSSFFYEICNPIAFTFTNAFLFGTGQSNQLVALYNLGMFLSLPPAFYFNGYLLRHVQFKTLIRAGVLLQGLTGILVFFIPSINSLSVFSFGFLFGIPVGLYWANRNFLSMDSTTDEQRAYYGGLEQVMSIMVGIVIPFVITLVIHFFSKDPATTIHAYRILAMLTFFVHIGNTFILSRIQVSNPPIKKIFLFRVSRHWQKVRLLMIILGVENGIEMFVPSLIILSFLGGVETLGALTSLSAAIGAIIVYTLTSRVQPTQRAHRSFYLVLIKITLATLYALFFSKQWALILILCSPSIIQLKYPLQHAQVLKILDDEEEGDKTNNYAFVADEEMCLNIGRIIGVIIFFSFSAYLTQAITFRFLPFISAATQLGVAFIVFSLAKHSYKKA